MKLFKLIVEIKYPTEKPDIFSFREKILTGINKDNKKVKTNVNDGFQFLVKEKRLKVMVESDRTGADIIISENTPHADQYSRDNLVKLFKQLNNIIHYQDIQRIGVRGMWIHPVEIEMEELIQRFKDKFYQENMILDKASDLAIVLTLKEEARTINYTVGPMNKEQINANIENESKQYASDAIMSATNDAVFFDYDYYSDKNIRYSDHALAEFITDALTSARNNIQETLKILEVIK
jgi:hypothetical protein